MHIFRAAQRIEERPPLAWGLAILSFALALGVRFVTDPLLPSGFPFLTFFPAVILSAFFCGIGPGLACALLSGFSAWYWFIHPQSGIGPGGPTALALTFYTFIVTVDLALIQATKTAMRELQAARETAAGHADQQRVMFQELQHRVANNMQFVSSLLNLQQRQIARDPQNAVLAIDEARIRLETIARIHRRLYDPETINQPVGAYFRELCGDVIETSGGRDVVCEVDVPPVSFELPKLMTLSLIIVEIVTNSLKHAFGEGRGGIIRLSLARLDADRLALTIADDGPGMAVDAPPVSPASLGRRIVEGLAAQMGGRMTYISDGGMTARLVFPG